MAEFWHYVLMIGWAVAIVTLAYGALFAETISGTVCALVLFVVACAGWVTVFG